MQLRRQILLVEDDPDDEALTLRAFRSIGVDHEVEVVRSGSEALASLLGEADDPQEPVPELPRVVLLDLKLPGVHGFEVLRRLRREKRTRWLPVVVLTSSDVDSDLAEAYRLGANSYVQKPISYRAFRDALTKLGEYWTQLNRQPPPG